MADEQSMGVKHAKHAGKDEGADSIFRVLRALRKGWPIIVAASLLAAAIGLLWAKTRPKVYDAAALVEFDPDVVKPLGNKGDSASWGMYWDTHEYYETQYKIMVSDRVMSTVVRDLSLQNDPDFLGYKPSEPAPLDEAVAMLRGRTFVEPVKGSRLVYVRVEDHNAAQAKRLADAIARAYIAQNLEKTVSATGDTVVWLSGQIDHSKAELEQTENALHDFKRRNDLPSSTLDEVSKMIRIEMQDYDSALTRTRTRRQELLARHQELSKIPSDNPDQIPASELLSNGFLQQLRTSYQQALREKKELAAEGKGENHPLMKKASEKLTVSRGHLEEEIKNIKGAVARDLAIIERQEAGEATLYEKARKRAVELNMKELEFHRLDRLRAQNEKLYSMLLEQLKEADLRRMMNTNNVRLVDPATEARAPIRPRVDLSLLIGAGVGLLLGLGLVLLKEQLDNTLKTPDDVEDRLGVTFLGLLPEVNDDDGPDTKGKKPKTRRPVPMAEGSRELIVHERPLSGVAEAARSLRTNLTFMTPDKPFRKILVTSAAPSEGKTTVATSIAISLAQGGHRVCIVDCDLRRPRLHRVFGREGDLGLTNVLLGEATIEEVALPTVVPNLWSIPCGPIPPNPADTVASERFKRTLDELLEHFDRVVLDSPPVVAVTDPAIISTLVDAVIFVIRAFHTPVTLSRSGLRTLRDVDAPLAGAVLNAVNLNRSEYTYHHYYYYKREGYAPHSPPIPVEPENVQRPPAPPN